VKRISLTLAALLVFTPGVSEAHIKWFCTYDTTVPPLPISFVITPTFLAVALLFCTLMFTAYVIDRAVDGSRWATRLDNAIFRSDACTSGIIRAAVAVLFVTLWATGGTILTPELNTTSNLVPWLQLAIAATMLSRSTLQFGAAGIMLLYVYAIAEYGAFHMLDYPIFPGVALYLALTSAQNPYLRALRMPVLYSSVAATMMWGAIEKFGYPYWTFPLLATHGDLTLGFSFDQFMYIAGFVEFSLAFFMLTGTTLLRWACAALLLLMTAAIPEFGKVDAIGHLPIIACLLAMIIAGQRTIQLPPALARTGVVSQAGILTLGYSATVVVSFALYYSTQFLAGR
jgi:hypothetical protein